VQQDEMTPKAIATFSGRLTIPADAVMAAGSTSSFCTSVGGQVGGQGQGAGRWPGGAGWPSSHKQPAYSKALLRRPTSQALAAALAVCRPPACPPLPAALWLGKAEGVW
jgi:hypothetical protein